MERTENETRAASEMRRLVAMREHALLSLSELSQELTISLDVFSLADVVLFNLMGQLGSSRSALWIQSEEAGTPPVLVRSHGIDRPLGQSLGPVVVATLMERLRLESLPLTLESIAATAGEETAKLLERVEIGVVGAIRARGEVLGLVALGPRVGGEPYGEVELRSLQAALSMVGVAIQNMSFYNRLLENHRKMRLAKEQLEELDRLKSEFLSNVNHELRTPLTCVIAYVDTLLETRHDPERVQHFLEVVMIEARKLQALLENLLALSAVAQRRLTFQVIDADVTKAIARYVEDRLPGLSEGLRELIYMPSPGTKLALVDERRLFQILDALVENAVKFTPPGARLALKVGPAFSYGCEWVRVELEDDGPGIPEAQVSGVFEAFRQADGSSTRTVGGLGIGLAIAHQIASSMDGRLTVKSQVGKGTTFSLDLPVATGDGSAPS